MTWTIGLLGLIHDHAWRHLGDLARRNDVQLAVAEPSVSLRAKAERDYGVTRLYADYAALLERERPDAALIFVDNAGKPPVVELVASFGVPVMVEKPMAATLAGAERMHRAVAAAGVPLMVNWPTAWEPALRHALRLASEGAIGEIFRLNVRGGHAGPAAFGCSAEFCDWLYDGTRNGGGASIDYCGYGASIARWLLGRPERVQASIGRLVTEQIAVDDNATMLLRYPRAMATIEATWTAAGPVPEAGPLLMGRNGSLVVQRQRSLREGESASRGHLLHITPDAPDGVRLEPPDLPPGEQTAIDYFLSCLANDRPFDGLVSLAVGRDTQEILEAGLQATTSGCEVTLPLGPSSH